MPDAPYEVELVAAVLRGGAGDVPAALAALARRPQLAAPPALDAAAPAAEPQARLVAAAFLAGAAEPDLAYDALVSLAATRAPSRAISGEAQTQLAAEPHLAAISLALAAAVGAGDGPSTGQLLVAAGALVALLDGAGGGGAAASYARLDDQLRAPGGDAGTGASSAVAAASAGLWRIAHAMLCRPAAVAAASAALRSGSPSVVALLQLGGPACDAAVDDGAGGDSLLDGTACLSVDAPTTPIHDQSHGPDAAVTLACDLAAAVAARAPPAVVADVVGTALAHILQPQLAALRRWSAGGISDGTSAPAAAAAPAASFSLAIQTAASPAPHAAAAGRAHQRLLLQLLRQSPPLPGVLPPVVAWLRAHTPPSSAAVSGTTGMLAPLLSEQLLAALADAVVATARSTAASAHAGAGAGAGAGSSSSSDDNSSCAAGTELPALAGSLADILVDRLSCYGAARSLPPPPTGASLTSSRVAGYAAVSAAVFAADAVPAAAALLLGVPPTSSLPQHSVLLAALLGLPLPLRRRAYGVLAARADAGGVDAAAAASVAAALADRLAAMVGSADAPASAATAAASSAAVPRRIDLRRCFTLLTNLGDDPAALLRAAVATALAAGDEASSSFTLPQQLNAVVGSLLDGRWLAAALAGTVKRDAAPVGAGSGAGGSTSSALLAYPLPARRALVLDLLAATADCLLALADAGASLPRLANAVASALAHHPVVVSAARALSPKAAAASSPSAASSSLQPPLSPQVTLTGAAAALPAVRTGLLSHEPLADAAAELAASRDTERVDCGDGAQLLLSASAAAGVACIADVDALMGAGGDTIAAHEEPSTAAGRAALLRWLRARLGLATPGAPPTDGAGDALGAAADGSAAYAAHALLPACVSVSGVLPAHAVLPHDGAPLAVPPMTAPVAAPSPATPLLTCAFSPRAAAALLRQLAHAPALPIPLLPAVRYALHQLSLAAVSADVGTRALPSLVRRLAPTSSLRPPPVARATPLQRALLSSVCAGLPASAAAAVASALLLQPTAGDGAASSPAASASTSAEDDGAVDAAAHGVTLAALQALTTVVAVTIDAPAGDATANDPTGWRPLWEGVLLPTAQGVLPLPCAAQPPSVGRFTALGLTLCVALHRAVAACEDAMGAAPSTGEARALLQQQVSLVPAYLAAAGACLDAASAAGEHAVVPASRSDGGDVVLTDDADAWLRAAHAAASPAISEGDATLTVVPARSLACSLAQALLAPRPSAAAAAAGSSSSSAAAASAPTAYRCARSADVVGCVLRFIGGHGGLCASVALAAQCVRALARAAAVGVDGEGDEEATRTGGDNDLPTPSFVDAHGRAVTIEAIALLPAPGGGAVACRVPLTLPPSPRPTLRLQRELALFACAALTDALTHARGSGNDAGGSNPLLLPALNAASRAVALLFAPSGPDRTGSSDNDASDDRDERSSRSSSGSSTSSSPSDAGPALVVSLPAAAVTAVQQLASELCATLAVVLAAPAQAPSASTEGATCAVLSPVAAPAAKRRRLVAVIDDEEEDDGGEAAPPPAAATATSSTAVVSDASSAVALAAPPTLSRAALLTALDGRSHGDTVDGAVAALLAWLRASQSRRGLALGPLASGAGSAGGMRKRGGGSAGSAAAATASSPAAADAALVTAVRAAVPEVAAALLRLHAALGDAPSSEAPPLLATSQRLRRAAGSLVELCRSYGVVVGGAEPSPAPQQRRQAGSAAGGSRRRRGGRADDDGDDANFDSGSDGAGGGDDDDGGDDGDSDSDDELWRGPGSGRGRGRGRGRGGRGRGSRGGGRGRGRGRGGSARGSPAAATASRNRVVASWLREEGARVNAYQDLEDFIE